MSQHDFNIANQGFPSFRTDLNNALVALATTSSGTAEPSTTFANQLWYETDTNILHIRNEANSAWLDLMVIDQTTGSPSFTAGNVGVGTSSPSYNLDVQGTGAEASVRIKNTSTGGGDPDANLYLDTGNSSGESAVKFQQGGVDAGNVSFVGSDLRLYSDIGGVGFYTGATNRMFVASAGNVGVGITSPARKLHVVHEDATTNTVVPAVRVSRSTTGTPATGIGAGIDFLVETADGVGKVGSVFEIVSTDITPSSEDFDFVLKLMAGGAAAAEVMRLTSAGNLALGTTSPIVQLQTSSDALVGGVVYRRQMTPAAFSSAATATIADLLLGMVRWNGAAATLTLPTGTDIENGVPASFPTNHSFDFSVVNAGSGTVTLGTATGLTLIGGMTVAAGASGMFRVRKTAANTYTFYRLS